MTKYRIKKVVSYHPNWGHDSPRVWYEIEWKHLLWWNRLMDVLGSKYNTFDTLEVAEEALKKHARFKAILDTDNKIEKVLKL